MTHSRQKTALDERLCPLCQQPNACGNLQSVHTEEPTGDLAVSASFDCWCLHQPVSAAALQQLSPDQRGQSCICQSCATDPVANQSA